MNDVKPFETIDIWELLGEAKRKEICDGYFSKKFNIEKKGKPLSFYFYPNTIQQNEIESNYLNAEFVKRISEKVGLRFVDENEKGADIEENASPVCYANSDEVSDDFKLEILPLTFTAIDILDYINAILHSSNFQKENKEFLKIDFLKVPYPPENRTFWKLVNLGKELRKIYLKENCSDDKTISIDEVNRLIQEIDQIEI